MKLLLFVIFLVPCVSNAAEYACNGANGWESVEASSKAEALSIANQRWPRNGGCVAGNAKDSFAVNPWFKNRQHLRPYLPSDIKLETDVVHRRETRKGVNNSTGFECDSTGAFLPDNSNDKGTCSTLQSASMGKWKMRIASRTDSDIHLWRMSGTSAKFWAHLRPSAPAELSQEAREYAKGRGLEGDQASGMDSSSPQRTLENRGTSNPADVVRDKVKSGISDIFKGLK